MTHPTYDRAPESLDDALEAALRAQSAGAAVGVPGARSEAPSAELRSLLPIAAALDTVPALDPARRAAIGAALIGMAGALATGDGTPGDEPPGGDTTAADAAPNEAPDANPSPAAQGAGVRTALGAIGVVAALLLLGALVWRARTLAGSDEPPVGGGRNASLDRGGGDADASAAGPSVLNPSGGAAAATADPALSPDPALSADADTIARATAAAARAAAALAAPARAAVTANPSAQVARLTAIAGGARPTTGPNDIAAGAGAAAPGSATSEALPTPAPIQPPAAATRRHPSQPSATPSRPVDIPSPAPSAPPAWTMLPCAALAQANVLVAHIVDESGVGLSDAIVTLFAAGDSDFASFGATDARGCAAIEQSAGRYDVRAEAAGHGVRWYPGADDQAHAVSVAVDAIAPSPPIEITLANAPAAATSTDSPTATTGAPSPTASIAPTPAPSPSALAVDFGRIDAIGAIGHTSLGADAVLGPTELPTDLRAQLAALAEFAQDGGSVTAVAVDEERAWGVVGPRVVAWPLAAPDGSATAPESWTPVLPEVPEALAVDGGRVAAAVPGIDGAPATVWLFDATADGRPGDPAGRGLMAALGACPLGLSGAERITSLAAADTWIYALTERGLSVIDAKRAAAPIEVGFVSAGAAPTGRAVGSLALLGAGTHVLVAGPSGLQVIDVRAPDRPAVVFQGIARDVHAVAADDGTLAVAIEAVTGRLAGVTQLRLTTLDIADPARPRVRSAVLLPGIGAPMSAPAARASVALRGPHAVVVDGDGRTLWAVDVRDPDAPTILRAIPLAEAPVDAAALTLDGDGAAVIALGALGLRTIAAAAFEPGSTAPSSAGFDPMPPVLQIVPTGDGRVAWAAAGSAGLVAVDIRPGAARRRLGGAVVTLADGRRAAVHSVLPIDRTVYALTEDAGLTAFDATDPTAPRRIEAPPLAAIAGGARTVQMATSDGRLFVPDAEGGIVVVDVTRPDAPTVVARLAGVATGDDDIAALAADDGWLFALTTDGRTSRLQAYRIADGPAPRPVGATVALRAGYRRIAIDPTLIVLSGDRNAPALGAVGRDRWTPVDGALEGSQTAAIELPGLAAGAVGLVSLPGGVRRALVADGGYLTAVDLDALADPQRRVSGRSVRLPLGRRAAGGTTDVAIVGASVFVAHGEAGLFDRPHGGIALPEAPRAGPPIGEGPAGIAAHRVFLPSVQRNHATCTLPERVHGVLLIDASPAAARWIAGGEAATLAAWRPAVAAWLGGLGVGERADVGASVIAWDVQADRVATGRDPKDFTDSLGHRSVRDGRRVDLALLGAANQLDVRAGPATAAAAGRVVIVADAPWPAEVQARAVAVASELRAAGWRVQGIALADVDGRVAALLGELTGSTSGVTRADAPADLPAAMAAAGRAAWTCGR